MTPDEPLSFDESKRKILDVIGEPRDLTFVRGVGNIGDSLINAGVRQMLAGVEYREVSILNFANAHGHTAVFPGAGGFCRAYHRNPPLVTQLEARFDRLIILPSSFDVTVDSVKSYLQGTRAHVFARERESYQQIRDLCRADLAHDCAFHFNFEPYRRRGHGTLTACRTDRESALLWLPNDNCDISYTGETFDEFLWTIARYELIRTDRAHVMIAAAMLGKRVEYWPSNYHKLPAIAEFSLANYPVIRIDPRSNREEGKPPWLDSPIAKQRNELPRYNYWPHWMQLTALDIADVVEPLSTCILIDGAQLGELHVYNRLFVPFLEQNGQYWGNPADDDQATTELERLRNSGAHFLIFAWTAYWWLDAYPQFYQHVRSRYPCRIENERIMIFELQPRT